MQENLFLTENSLSLGDFGDDDSRFQGVDLHITLRLSASPRAGRNRRHKYPIFRDVVASLESSPTMLVLVGMLSKPHENMPKTSEVKLPFGSFFFRAETCCCLPPLEIGRLDPTSAASLFRSSPHGVGPWDTACVFSASLRGFKIRYIRCMVGPHCLFNHLSLVLTTRYLHESSLLLQYHAGKHPFRCQLKIHLQT